MLRHLNYESLAGFSGEAYDEGCVWFEAGAETLSDDGLNYFGSPKLIPRQSMRGTYISTLVIMGVVESRT